MNNVVETLLLIINLLKNQALTLDIFICTKSWYLYGDKIWRCYVWLWFDGKFVSYIQKLKSYRKAEKMHWICCMRWPNLTLEIFKCYPLFGWRIGFKQFKKSCQNYWSKSPNHNQRLKNWLIRQKFQTGDQT